MPEGKPNEAKIHFIMTIDDWGTWDNQPIIKIIDNENNDNSCVKAAARLTRFRYELKILGIESVNSPNRHGTLPVY